MISTLVSVGVFRLPKKRNSASLWSVNSTGKVRKLGHVASFTRSFKVKNVETAIDDRDSGANAKINGVAPLQSLDPTETLPGSTRQPLGPNTYFYVRNDADRRRTLHLRFASKPS